MFLAGRVPTDAVQPADPQHAHPAAVSIVEELRAASQDARGGRARYLNPGQRWELSPGAETLRRDLSGSSSALLEVDFFARPVQGSPLVDDLQK